MIGLFACAGAPEDSAAPEESATSGCGDVPVAQALARLFVGEADACAVEWYLAQLDAIEADRSGPWQERLWRMPVHGTDMDVAASEALRDRAAVPEVVRGDDGRIYLYFVEGDLDFAREVAQTGSDWFKEHGLIGYGAIAALVSDDDGASFTELEDFGITDIVPGFVADPDVVRLPGGGWRMYYVGQRVEELGPMSDPAPISADTIFYADSTDLVRWSQLGEAVEGVPADPSVWCGGDCLLVGTGLSWARSSDGGAVFGVEDAPIVIGGFAPELVEGEESLELYFNSMEVGGALGWTESPDGGLSWAEPREVVGPCLVEAPSFIADELGQTWAFYHYYTNGRSGSDFGEHAGDSAYSDPCDEVEDPRED